MPALPAPSPRRVQGGSGPSASCTWIEAIALDRPCQEPQALSRAVPAIACLNRLGSAGHGLCREPRLCRPQPTLCLCREPRLCRGIPRPIPRPMPMPIPRPMPMADRPARHRLASRHSHRPARHRLASRHSHRPARHRLASRHGDRPARHSGYAANGLCPCRIPRRWSRVAHDGARPAVALPAPSTGASRRLACLARVAAVKPALPSPHHSLSSLAADEVMDALARWTCGTASQSGPAHRLMSLILHL